MSGQQLRAVIVGCGGFSDRYLGVYRTLPSVQPILCYDIREDAAAKWGTEFGADYTTDFDVVKRATADIAVVSTPNFMHYEHASELLLAGKHVLVQKPLARSLEESEKLHAIAHAHPARKLGIYMSMLDFEMWWELRTALQQEAVFGKVVEISIRLGHTGGLQWGKADASSWRLSKDRTGGGAFIMLGVHYLHLMRWLTGLGIRKVCAQAVNRQCPHIEGEDICLVQGELTNGILFQLCTAWNSQGEHFALYGTKGSFMYLDNQVVRINASAAWKTKSFTYEPKGDWTSFPCVPPALDDSMNAFNQHIQFATAIQDGLEPSVGADDGLYDMRVVDAVYRSAASGQWEVVDES